jgi:hypothetical protein
LVIFIRAVYSLFRHGLCTSNNRVVVVELLSLPCLADSTKYHLHKRDALLQEALIAALGW